LSLEACLSSCELARFSYLHFFATGVKFQFV
jgi:hypothetical protein